MTGCPTHRTHRYVSTAGMVKRTRINFTLNVHCLLRRIFGPRREEITGEWRKLHSEELNDMYCSPNIVWVIKSRRMRWVGHVARMVEGRGVYRVLVRNPEGKRPLGRPRRRWENNIKMDLQEVGFGGVDWIELAQIGTDVGHL